MHFTKTNEQNTEPLQITVTQEQLLREAADLGHYDPETVRRVHKALEELLLHYLSSASPGKSVSVKLMNGLSVESKYLPERCAKHPKTQEPVTARASIRAQPKLTRYFNRKLDASADPNQSNDRW